MADDQQTAGAEAAGAQGAAAGAEQPTEGAAAAANDPPTIETEAGAGDGEVEDERAGAHPHATLAQAFEAELASCGDDVARLTALGETVDGLKEMIDGALKALAPAKK